MNPKDQSNSIDARERVRKSYNKHRINNPFDKDYSVVWDGFHHVVKAHSFAILEEFLANKWLEEQCKRIITEKADKAIKDENKRRITNNQLPMDRTRKTGEQLEFESPFYANWEASFKQIIKEYGLYGGLIEEYGMQYVPIAPQQNNQMGRSIIEELGDEPTTPQMAPAPEGGSLTDELQSKDVFTLKKLAKEKGIETHLNDKKADLIAKLTA